MKPLKEKPTMNPMFKSFSPPAQTLPSPPARKPRKQSTSLVLRFTPTAWAKLCYFCHAGDTEIGGFGISAPDDPLLVEDFVTVRQRTTSVTVAFDDAAVADFYEDQVDQGRAPAQFSRIWLHTHPGTSPHPSSVDEATLERVFGNCDWAVMAILARGGQTYVRLCFNTGPGGAMLIPVEVDFSLPFAGSDHAAWQAEYEAHIHPEPHFALGDLNATPRRNRFASALDSMKDWDASELMEVLAGEDLGDDCSR
jgi:proteasome lid subunit RPN8/RPN11